jgi:hypothetical protein
MLVQGTCEYHHSLGRERSFVVDQATPMEPLDGSWLRKLPQQKNLISRRCSGLVSPSQTIVGGILVLPIDSLRWSSFGA